MVLEGHKSGLPVSCETPLAALTNKSATVSRKASFTAVPDLQRVFLNLPRSDSKCCFASAPECGLDVASVDARNGTRPPFVS